MSRDNPESITADAAASVPQPVSAADNKDDEVDIDLADPDVQKAAVFMQSGFKGFKQRKISQGLAKDVSSASDAQQMTISVDNVHQHHSEVNLPTQCEHAEEGEQVAGSVHGQEEEQEHAPVEASANLPSLPGDGDEAMVSTEAGFHDVKTRMSVTEVATDQPFDDPSHQQQQPVDCNDGKQGKEDGEEKAEMAGEERDLLAELGEGKSEVENKRSADELEMEDSEAAAGHGDDARGAKHEEPQEVQTFEDVEQNTGKEHLPPEEENEENHEEHHAVEHQKDEAKQTNVDELEVGGKVEEATNIEGQKHQEEDGIDNSAEVGADGKMEDTKDDESIKDVISA